MKIYYFIFVWVALFAPISRRGQLEHPMLVEGKYVSRWGLLSAIFLFLPVIYIAAFTIPRSDTGLYLYGYQHLETSMESLKNLINDSKSGVTFTVFEWIIKRLSGGSEYAFRFILCMIHCIPVLYVFRKYSEDYLLSVYLFLATGCHLAWMMNGLRQFMAVSIIMAATPWMLRKKQVALILTVLFASTIHTSALLMLPVVFVAQGKPWNWKTVLFIFGTVIMMAIFSRNVGLMDVMLENTEYAGSISTMRALGDDGANPIRVLVNSIPAILSWVGRRNIRALNDSTVDLCVNMSVVTAGISLIAMVTSGVMVGRLVIYTSLYSFILLPYLIQVIFSKNSRALVRRAMIVLYFGYYLYGYAGY